MSANWQALSKERHLSAGWVSPTNYNHAKSTNVIPVVGAEVSQLLPFFPLAFLKTDSDRFQLVALLSLRAGVNVFVNPQGKWVVPYTPSMLRSYPFNLAANGTGGYVLAADTSSEFFFESEHAGTQPVLNQDGSPSDALQSVMSFMQARIAQQTITDKAVQALFDHGLLESWAAEDDDQVKHAVNGVYRVNESMLKSLKGEALEALSQSGAIGIAYAQLFSLARLKDLKVRQAHHEQLNTSKPLEEKMDLDKLFDGQSGNDVFSF